jgi:hypothetical protein
VFLHAWSSGDEVDGTGFNPAAPFGRTVERQHGAAPSIRFRIRLNRTHQLFIYE